MQRRLFLLFVLFSMMPALVILAVNWQISQRYLDYLDSPGLQQSLESSLELARERLAQELAAAAGEARELAGAISVAGNTWPEPGDGSGFLFISQDGSQRMAGELPPQFFNSVRQRFPSHQKVPARLAIDDGDWLVAAVEKPEGRLLYVRPLAVELAQRLDAVAQGSSRFRQLRLYYSDLLRTDTVFTLLIYAVAVLAISLMLSRRLAHQIARPVRALARGTEQVAEGNLELFIDVDATDELGDLVSAFNRMTGDLKKSKEDLVRAERVAAWQGIARRLAHEIKNPLTPIALAMHRIEKRSQDAAISDSVATVLNEVDNLKRLADEFSLYARVPEPIYEMVDLHDLLRDVIDLYIDPRRVTVNWQDADSQTPWRILVDPGQMRQVIANLVKNAVHAMAGKGRLTVRFTRAADRITVSLVDSGPGLPEPAQQVFEPYFTTRATGTGLGLAIARKIVEDHGGDLEAMNNNEGGAEFRLTLPAIEEETN